MVHCGPVGITGFPKLVQLPPHKVHALTTAGPVVQTPNTPQRGEGGPCQVLGTNHSIFLECGQADPAPGRNFLISLTPGECSGGLQAAASPSGQTQVLFPHSHENVQPCQKKRKKIQRPKDTQSVPQTRARSHLSAPPPE